MTPRVKVTFHDTDPPEDVTFSDPIAPEYHERLKDINADNHKGVLEDRMHDDDHRVEELRGPDGAVRGIWLEVVKNPNSPLGRFYLRHWRGSPIAGKHDVPAVMTPEHCARQEYSYLRGEEYGWNPEVNKRISGSVNRRPDVTFNGPQTVAWEIVETCPANLTDLRKRNKGLDSTGASTLWVPRRKSWFGRFAVATVETNERLGMKPGQWTVTSIPITASERCGPGIDCPNRNENRSTWCKGTHLKWIPEGGNTVDKVIELSPAGELIRFNRGGELGTVLTYAWCAEAWLNEHPELLNPNADELAYRRKRGKNEPSQMLGHNRSYPVQNMDIARVEAVVEAPPPRRTEKCTCCKELLAAAHMSAYGNCADCADATRRGYEDITRRSHRRGGR